MKIHQISGPPSASLARALAEFEEPFTYPLGPGRSFRIAHGDDYTLFFRVLGDGACFIAEHQGRVVGALGSAVRQLRMPDGTERAVAYLGDLKIAVNARGSTVLVRLARSAEACLRPRVEAGFGVVMDGTVATPDAYTGRAGIPFFQDLGHLTVFRIPRSDEGSKGQPCHFQTTQEIGLACYRRLTAGRYACAPGDAEKRSQIKPLWLINQDGSACGMLEDTRKAKRLITGDGLELLSAHLSCFGYNTVSAGAQLIDIARRQLAGLGFPAMFVAVAQTDAREFRESLPNAEITAAPATVYGAGLPAGIWNINSSEI
jgi:hypothetical protein